MYYENVKNTERKMMYTDFFLVLKWLMLWASACLCRTPWNVKNALTYWIATGLYFLR